jgi:uncharacterized membrane protein
MKKPSPRSLLVASLAGVLSVPVALATFGSSTAAHDIEEVHCYGVNKCKGTGDCGGPGHSCANQNSCKRQGYLDMDKELCLKIDGGRLTAEAEKGE